MIALVGLGIDTGDISIKAMDFLIDADIILAEKYTGNIPKDYFGFIESKTGKQVTIVLRSDLEENIKKTLMQAADKKVALLIVGDPLIATTHKIVIEEAQKMGIKTAIYHSSSVITAAIGETGLSTYKFGAITTLPFWTANYQPLAFLDVIKANLSNGLHTLVLLDYDSAKDRSMNLDQAIKTLMDADIRKEFGIINTNTDIIVAQNLGRSTQSISLIKISDIDKIEKKYGNNIICLIITAQMSFPEISASSKFRIQ